jgi:hypothetical protein
MRMTVKPIIKIFRNCLLVAALFVVTGFDTKQKTTISLEQQVKAVFLFNFAQFVEWPATTFLSPSSPIVIGILGKDPFGSFLQETIDNEQVNGRPLIIQRYSSVAEVKGCHILFIHASVAPKLDAILKALKGKQVLTVSDLNNFAKQGGMVRFVKESNKVKLRINVNAAKAEGITISSKILRLSEIVNSDES